jgi:hypothetical protein
MLSPHPVIAGTTDERSLLFNSDELAAQVILTLN